MATKSSIMRKRWKDPEYREKMTEAMLGNTRGFKKGQRASLATEFKKGKNHFLYGKHRSEEFKRKLSKERKGARGSNWKGGITPINKRIRAGIEFRLWREAVFARDNWTCQECDIRGGRLHPHHIKGFADYPELRFAIDNGITTCVGCHRKIHSTPEGLKKAREYYEKFGNLSNL